MKTLSRRSKAMRRKWKKWGAETMMMMMTTKMWRKRETIKIIARCHDARMKKGRIRNRKKKKLKWSRRSQQRSPRSQ